MVNMKKILVPVLLLVAMLVSMTTEKVTLVWLLRIVRHNSPNPTTRYLSLVALILGPYGFSLLQIFWNVPFLTRSTARQLPSWNSLVLGILSGVIEGVCMVFFTMEVAPVLPVYILFPALNGVFGLPILLDRIQDLKTKLRSSNQQEKTVLLSGKREGHVYPELGYLFLNTLPSLLPVVVICILYFGRNISSYQAVVFGLTLLGLSLVWSPAVQLQSLSINGRLGATPQPVHLLYMFIKIATILAFICIHFYFRAMLPAMRLMEMLCQFSENITNLRQHKIFMPLFLNFFSGLFTHAFSYLAMAFCIPLFGIIIPSILSTAGTVVLCSSILAKYVYHVNEMEDFGRFVSLMAAAAMSLLVWCIPYLVNCSEFVKKPLLLFVPFETLFLSYGWNSVYLDQKIFLSYRHDGFSRIPANKHQALKKASRIFICTTMYREADYEMERLLLSLQGLSLSKQFANISLEAHIFMDSGCCGDQLKEFSQQLVELILTKLHLTISDAVCLETPYGIQMVWSLLGGMPLFVHLKDPQKVKPKKRWSQAMYIHYMMNFRAILSQDEAINKQIKENIQLQANLSLIQSTSRPGPTNLMFSHNLGKIGYPTLTDYHHIHCPRRNSVTSVTNFSGLSYSANVFKSKEEEKSPKENPFETDKMKRENSIVGKKGVINEALVIEEPGFSSNSDLCTNFSNDMIVLDPSKINQSVTQTLLSDMKIEIEDEQPDMKVSGASKVCLSDEKKAKGVFQDGEFSQYKDFYKDVDDDQTYILATDADMEFKDEAVLELLNICNQDKRLGAACGRTHPIGKKSGPIVWHQIFEYAKDFWMIKNAQNVIGSVMCCPGCFSLYRATAIKQVMKKYTTPTKSPFTVYVKDTGEDRWMATLMMIQGWRLRYSCFAHNTTYCPDNFEEFLKQRRRWVLSDIANAILVVQNLFRLIRNNDCFSFCYVVYMLNMFLNNIITPGTAIVMVTAGLDLVFSIPYNHTTPPVAAIVLVYSVFCTKASIQAQTHFTTILTVIFGGLFFSVVVWGSATIISNIIVDIMNDRLHFQQHYVIILLTLSLAYAAFMHPREVHKILYGLAYVFIFPAMHILLPIYGICNIVDQSWGTRDSQTAKKPKVPCLFHCMRRKKKCVTSKAESIKGSENTLVDLKPMGEGDELQRSESLFWKSLRDAALGNDVNQGLEKAELAVQLRTLRNRCFIGMMVVNGLWLGLLSFFYMGVSSPLSKLNVYGVISGALYGFTLIIQVVGLTACRLNYLFKKFAVAVYGDERPIWVSERIYK